MPEWLSGLLVGGAGQAISSGINGIFGGIARRDAYRLNEMAANNADTRYRNMYKDLFSPTAQMEQLKNAGLSPSMYYAGNGTGGQGATIAQGEGSSGMNNPSLNIDPLKMAQIKNIDADTNLKDEQAKQVAPEAEASIIEKLANAGYQKAATAFTNAREKAQNLANYITDRTKEHSIYKICSDAEEAGYAAKKAYYEAIDSKVNMEFDLATYDDRCKIVKKQLEELGTLIDVNRSKWRLNDTQSKQIREEIDAMWDKIDQGWRSLEIEQQNTTNYAKWLDEYIPILQQQMEIKLKELGIEKERLVIDAVTETIKAFATGAAAASQFGKGSNQSPPMPEGMHRQTKTSVKPGMQDWRDNSNTWF